jgi:hypothetical protein
MKLVRLFAAAFVVAVSTAALAQEFIVFVDREKRFAVNLPSQPQVEDFTYETEYGASIPGRRYTASRADDKYIVTVLDYNDAGTPLTDVRGSIAFNAAKYRQLGKVTFDGYQEIDRIPGLQLAIMTPENRRIYVGFNLYDKRLYILKANLPGNRPPPEHFRASLQVLDPEGLSIRLDDNGAIGQRRPINQQ